MGKSPWPFLKWNPNVNGMPELRCDLGIQMTTAVPLSLPLK